MKNLLLMNFCWHLERQFFIGRRINLSSQFLIDEWCLMKALKWKISQPSTALASMMKIILFYCWHSKVRSSFQVKLAKHISTISVLIPIHVTHPQSFFNYSNHPFFPLRNLLLCARELSQKNIFLSAAAVCIDEEILHRHEFWKREWKFSSSWYSVFDRERWPCDGALSN